jgi:hypothetical protein
MGKLEGKVALITVGNSGIPTLRARGLETMVDERGFEPPASSLRTMGKIS